ncbi:MAG TPA: NAD(P)H-quinone oxidoreductase [Mycobacteriales bacterium]|nr:NAD(P)H-quinone oxidoreductase [Mycobacteriales bacterium]
MRAIVVAEPGGLDAMSWEQVEDPQPGEGEVLVDVVATAVNRADLLQRQGFYPPPPGASDIIGLECSGRVAQTGPAVTRWSVGDEVCALLAGGGYAERVAVPEGQCMPVPDGVDLTTAAALPEVACTVWSNVVEIGRLRSGDAFLVHGGSSGIGTMALQVAKALGAGPVICTVGTEEKAKACLTLGADVAVNYRDEDFGDRVQAATDGRGVDVILDIIGAKYLAANLDALAADGRLVIIGLQGGARAELDLGLLLRSRGAVHATTLRGRPLAQKAVICAAVVEGLWPLIEAGQVRPVVHTVLPLPQAAQAHQLVEESSHVGKVLLARP